VSVNSLGNPWSQSRRGKEGYGGKDLQKRKVSAWNERVRGDGIGLLIIISMNVSSITTV